jgi:hypothetical protein
MFESDQAEVDSAVQQRLVDNLAHPCADPEVSVRSKQTAGGSWTLIFDGHTLTSYLRPDGKRLNRAALKEESRTGGILTALLHDVGHDEQYIKALHLKRSTQAKAEGLAARKQEAASQSAAEKRVRSPAVATAAPVKRRGGKAPKALDAALASASVGLEGLEIQSADGDSSDEEGPAGVAAAAITGGAGAPMPPAPGTITSPPGVRDASTSTSTSADASSPMADAITPPPDSRDASTSADDPRLEEAKRWHDKVVQAMAESYSQLAAKNKEQSQRLSESEVERSVLGPAEIKEADEALHIANAAEAKAAADFVKLALHFESRAASNAAVRVSWL